MSIPVLVDNDGGTAIGEQAISLYNLGSYGTPQRGGGLRLSAYEVLYLTEKQKIEPLSSLNLPLREPELFEMFSQTQESFSVRYIVYKDLRNRNHVLNQGAGSTFFFRLYPRGSKISTASAKHYIRPLKEGSSIEVSDLEELLKKAQESKKSLIMGLVDALGDVSYLKVKEFFVYPNKEPYQFDSFENWDWNKEWEKIERSIDDKQ